jgi:hypothetical protein
VHDLTVFTSSLTLTAVGRLLGAATVTVATITLIVVVGAAAVATATTTSELGARPRGLTWMLVLAGFGFALATALTRVQFGVSNWQSPRYAYVVAALALPLLGVAIDRITRIRRVGAVAVAVLVPVAIGLNGRALRTAHHDRAGLEQHLETRWTAAAQLLRQGLDPIPINVDRYWSPNLHTDQLQDLVAAGDLHVPAQPVPDPWRLEAEIELRSVLHGPSPFDQLTRPVIAGADADGCVTLAPGEPTDITVHGPTGLEFVFTAPTLARLSGTTASGRTVAFPRILALRTPSPRAFWIDLDEPITFHTTIDNGGTICPITTKQIIDYANTQPG